MIRSTTSRTKSGPTPPDRAAAKRFGSAAGEFTRARPRIGLPDQTRSPNGSTDHVARPGRETHQREVTTKWTS